MGRFTVMARKRVALVLLCFALGGCGDFAFSGNPTTLHSRYSPLHPGASQNVTFTIEAEDPEAQGISEVRLYVYEYALTTGDNGLPQAVKRKDGQWGEVEVWDGPWVLQDNVFTGTYTHDGGFPDESYVAYIVRWSDQSGSSLAEQWVFAAGEWPFGKMPIPVLSNGPPGKRVNVCFVADASYDQGNMTAGVRAMLDDVEEVIFDGFHTSNALDDHQRRLWQFYYSPEITPLKDLQPLSDIPESVWDSPIATHPALVHKTNTTNYGTGPHFTLNGEEDPFGNKDPRVNVAVHEATHAIFGLADEYTPGPPPYFELVDPSVPHHNVFKDPNPANEPGWEALGKRKLVDGWWAHEPENPICLMKQTDSMHDLQQTCIGRVRWYYEKLDAEGPDEVLKLVGKKNFNP
ncbi:MAG: hypothetical protein AAGF92_06275 [Myxococcota bacterium]